MAAPPRRPSPAERRRRRTRTLALVVAIALVATLAVPLVALAAPGPTAVRGAVPSSVASGTARDAEDAREVLGAARVHEVWLWTTAFLRGDAGALDEPLDSADQWVSAAADGTRTAWRDPELDQVVQAGSDDDGELAQALAGLAPDERLVTDEGDWLVLGPDGTVRTLLPDRAGHGPESPMTLSDFQAVRSARWEAVLAEAESGASEGMAGGGGGSAVTTDDDGSRGRDALRSAVPWAVGAAVLLTGTALAVRARRDRARGGSDRPA